jgi:hypothetical protein
MRLRRDPRVAARALLALLQPEACATASYTNRAYDGALLLALFIQDLHYIRRSWTKISGGNQIDDG